MTAVGGAMALVARKRRGRTARAQKVAHRAGEKTLEHIALRRLAGRRRFKHEDRVLECEARGASASFSAKRRAALGVSITFQSITTT